MAFGLAKIHEHHTKKVTNYIRKKINKLDIIKIFKFVLQRHCYKMEMQTMA